MPEPLYRDQAGKKQAKIQKTNARIKKINASAQNFEAGCLTGFPTFAIVESKRSGGCRWASYTEEVSGASAWMDGWVDVGMHSWACSLPVGEKEQWSVPVN